VKKVLVVGLQKQHPGKTTLCKAIIYGLKEVGIKPVPFKPHSGMSYWNQFDTFQKNLTKSSLVCKDILSLEQASKSKLPLEILNPVNRLVRPTSKIQKSQARQTIDEFLAQRFTYHDGTRSKNIYLLKNIRDSNMRDMDKFILKIKKNAEKTLFVKNFQELLEAYRKYFATATLSCYEYINDKSIVIESFNDAAYPFDKVSDCKFVLCVSSNIILQIKPSKYFKCLDFYAENRSKLQLTVSQIISSRLIEKRFKVQPLNSREQDDPRKLKQNYSEIINQII
jgi:predicted P-loop ATPase/GTPase